MSRGGPLHGGAADALRQEYEGHGMRAHQPFDLGYLVPRPAKGKTAEQIGCEVEEEVADACEGVVTLDYSRRTIELNRPLNFVKNSFEFLEVVVVRLE